MSDLRERETWRAFLVEQSVERGLAWLTDLVRRSGSLWPEGLVTQRPMRPMVVWRVDYRALGLPGKPGRRLPMLHPWPRSTRRAAPGGYERPEGTWWGIVWSGGVERRWELTPSNDHGECLRVITRGLAFWCDPDEPHRMIDFLREWATAVMLPDLEAAKRLEAWKAKQAQRAARIMGKRGSLA